MPISAPPRIVCIDGCIGAGKSAVLGWLRGQGYTVFAEDVDAWRPLLECFYADATRWAFTLQMKILLSMHEMHDHIQSREATLIKDGVVFVERCPDSAMAFVALSVDSGALTPEEAALYRAFADRMFWRPDGYVLLEAPVDTCMRRIHKRGRPMEMRVERSYLSRLASKYEDVYEGIHDVTRVRTDGQDVSDVGGLILSALLPPSSSGSP